MLFHSTIFLEKYMKIQLFLLFIFFATMGFSEEEKAASKALSSQQETSLKNTKLKGSYSYFRLGGFTIGGELALGHRFRSERFGWGPNINVAASFAVLPSVLGNFEMLYYPKSWKNGYWGIMPGIGIGRIAWEKSTKTTLSTIDGKVIDESFSNKHGRKWHLWAGLELIFGKEFRKNGKRHFHQLSIGFPYIGYNYGWAF